MRIDVITVFPEYLQPLDLSLIGRARQRGTLDLTVHDLRNWTHDVHRTVDDSPAGGGAGMIMRPEPWGECFDELLGDTGSTEVDAPDDGVAERAPSESAAFKGTASESAGSESTASKGTVSESTGSDSAVLDRAVSDDAAFDSTAAAGGTAAAPLLLVPSPAGAPFNQSMAEELAQEDWLLFACGRYEGIDQRVLDHAATRMRVREVSLGDYVLFGGEVAVLAMVEAVTRLLPGVLGNAESLREESHTGGLLEAPMYTKPASWRGLDVPEVLLSGHHAKIARWRRDQSLLRTLRQRPDLIERLDSSQLDKGDRELLEGAGCYRPDADMAE